MELAHQSLAALSRALAERKVSAVEPFRLANGKLCDSVVIQTDGKQTVDPSILGGLIVKIGSRLYDTSIKSRLQRLSYAMKGAA